MTAEARTAGARDSAETENRLLEPRYTRWAVFVLFLVSVVNFADRAILAVLAQPIKEELLLSDTDLGLLQGLGFAIFYSILGVPLGLLAERANRVRLLAGCIAAWSLMTLACGLASSFTTMLLGRIGVGVGEAGAQPVTSSLISDHFTAGKRGSMLGLILLGSPVGFLLGQSVGGYVGSEWGWRAGFYAMGAPGVLIALLVLVTLREPPRGRADRVSAVEASKAPALREVLGYLWAKPSFRHALAGFVILGFAMNAIGHFVLPFYLRGFAVPLATLGVLFGVVSFFSNGFGLLAGGFGCDWLSARDQRWVMWAPTIALLVSMPFFAGAFLSRDITLSLGLIFFGNLFLGSVMAPSIATMQNLAAPRMRATASAVSALGMGIVGTGLGPTVVGVLSDYFGTRAFGAEDFAANCPGGRGLDGIGTALDAACVAASAEGLRTALLCVLVVLVWAAVHYWLAAKTLVSDLYDRKSAAPSTV